MDVGERGRLSFLMLIAMQPIDMVTILARIVDGAYGALADCLDDLDLMIRNAHTFNDETSLVI